MATVTLKGNPFHTLRDLPAVGSTVADFVVTSTQLQDVHLADFKGWKVLNIFPSVDTPVCALSVRQFNARAGARPGVTVLNISADLPFAHARFCGAEGLANVLSFSTFRSTFPGDLGLAFIDGPLKGLCSRCVLVLDEANKVVWAEQVPEVAQEPAYDAALAVLP